MASVEDIERAIRAGTRDGLKDVARVVLDVGSEVIERSAIDEGTLLGSGEVVDLSEGRAIVFAARWTAEHAAWVHYGTAPHWPPFEPIRAWVERNVLIDLTTSEAAFKPASRDGYRDPRAAEVDRIARAVQAKIAREGTQATPYALQGAEVARAEATSIVIKAINERLARL